MVERRIANLGRVGACLNLVEWVTASFERFTAAMG
jgi:hypothetical protein